MATRAQGTVARVIHISRFDPGNPEHVYIGRPGKGQRGPFGNPVKVGEVCPECGAVHREGGSTLACYERIARRRIAEDPVFARSVAGLADKVLSCFCAPRPCHGDVLARLAREEADRLATGVLGGPPTS